MNKPTPSAEIVKGWRKEFESNKTGSTCTQYDDGSYINLETENQWKWFLAARSTVVIPLPKPFENEYTGSSEYHESCVVDAIESQGYKTSRGE